MEQDDTRKVGEVVEHHIFGRGTIEEIDVKRASYLIRFEKFAQPRSISCRYFEHEHEDIRQKYIGQENTAGGGEGQQADIAGAGGLNLAGGDVCAAEETERSEEDREVYACEVCGIEEAECSEEDREVYACEVCGIEETERSEENKEVNVCEVYTVEGVDCSETYQAVGEPDEDNARESDLLRALRRKVEQLKSDTPNLWKSDDVPHDGWTCSGIEDLGAPVGICEMCGYQIIRYAHHMEHPRYHSLTAGCVCAGRMEGDIEAAKRREADYKNRESRRASFFKKKWKHSKKGNEYLKTDGHVIVLCQLERTRNQWKYAIDNTFCKTLYSNRDTAAAAVFDALEEMRGSRETARKIDREK